MISDHPMTRVCLQSSVLVCSRLLFLCLLFFFVNSKHKAVTIGFFFTDMFRSLNMSVKKKPIVTAHAVVKLRCKKETMESWQQSARKEPHAFASSFSFSFIFPLL